MINYADERIKAINLKIQGLKSKGCAVLSPDKWDRTFMQLKGIKGYWNELTWDQIIMECPELSWITPIRNDPTFKEYYKLMTDLDQLLQLKGEQVV